MLTNRLRGCCARGLRHTASRSYKAGSNTSLNDPESLGQGIDKFNPMPMERSDSERMLPVDDKQVQCRAARLFEKTNHHWLFDDRF